MHGSQATNTFFLFFCFLFSTRELRNAHRRFYEVSEDKKPECGMEMVLLVLKDWLRLSTDANTTPVAPLVFLWSQRWQQLSQMMTLSSLLGTSWDRAVAVKPGTGSLQCKVCMLFISFLLFWISTNGVKYFSHAVRLVLKRSLCSHVILLDSLPSAMVATWLPTLVSRSVYRWNVSSTIGWCAVTFMRPRSADFYSNMSELFREISQHVLHELTKSLKQTCTMYPNDIHIHVPLRMDCESFGDAFIWSKL